MTQITLRRELTVILAALIILCPLSIAVDYYVATVAPLPVAFFAAIIVDMFAGYAFLIGMLPSASTQVVVPTPISPAPTASPQQPVLPQKKARQGAVSRAAKEVPTQSIVEPPRTEPPKQGDDVVARLVAMLPGIDQTDIVQVVEEYRRGTRRIRKVGEALHWGSRKHAPIVGPILKALQAMEEKQ